MHRDERQARWILDEAIPMTRESTQSAWRAIKTLIHMIESNPLLSLLACRLDYRADGQHIYNTDQVPADPAEWGARAAATLRAAYHMGRPVVQGSALGQLMQHENADDNWHVVRSTLVDPMIRWLRWEMQESAHVEAALERWVRRTEWFPLTGDPLVEDDLQLDLHRFLFDQGLEPIEGLREAHAVRGRADFLLLGDPPVVVEMKVWRAGYTKHKLREAFAQVEKYPHDFGISCAYLVIANDNPDERLQLDPGLQDSAPLRWNGCDFYFRIADLRRPRSSEETRRVRTLTRETFLVT